MSGNIPQPSQNLPGPLPNRFRQALTCVPQIGPYQPAANLEAGEQRQSHGRVALRGQQFVAIQMRRDQARIA